MLSQVVHDLLSIHAAAREDVQGHQVFLDPDMDADMGFGDEEETAEAVGLELVEVGVKDLCSGAFHCFAQDRPEWLDLFQYLPILQPKVEDEVSFFHRRLFSP